MPTRFFKAPVTQAFLWDLSFGRLITTLASIDFSRNQVLMPACSMSATQQIRVVHRNPELARIHAQRFEQAVFLKIKEDKVLQIAHPLRPLVAQRVAFENGATKIGDRELQPTPAQAIC